MVVTAAPTCAKRVLLRDYLRVYMRTGPQCPPTKSWNEIRIVICQPHSFPLRRPLWRPHFPPANAYLWLMGPKKGRWKSALYAAQVVYKNTKPPDYSKRHVCFESAERRPLQKKKSCVPTKIRPTPIQTSLPQRSLFRKNSTSVSESNRCCGKKVARRNAALAKRGRQLLGRQFDEFMVLFVPGETWNLPSNQTIASNNPGLQIFVALMGWYYGKYQHIGTNSSYGKIEDAQFDETPAPTNSKTNSQKINGITHIAQLHEGWKKCFDQLTTSHGNTSEIKKQLPWLRCMADQRKQTLHAFLHSLIF